MARININTGNNANDGTGDDLRSAFISVNANFTELYDASPISSQITIEGNKINTNSSNADLVLEPAGTGAIVLPAITIKGILSTIEVVNGGILYSVGETVDLENIGNGLAAATVSKIKSGSVINARAIATLCCSPPDNSLGK